MLNYLEKMVQITKETQIEQMTWEQKDKKMQYKWYEAASECLDVHTIQMFKFPFFIPDARGAALYD